MFALKPFAEDRWIKPFGAGRLPVIVDEKMKPLHGITQPEF